MLGMRDSDIFSKVSFHGPLNGNELLLTLLKIAVAVYRFMDYSESGFRVFLIASAVLYLAFLVRRGQKPTFFNRKTECLSQSLTNFVFWFALAKLMQHLTGEWNTGLPFFFLLVSLAALLVTVDAVKLAINARLLYQPLIILKS